MLNEYEEKLLSIVSKLRAVGLNQIRYLYNEPVSADQLAAIIHSLIKKKRIVWGNDAGYDVLQIKDPMLKEVQVDPNLIDTAWFIIKKADKPSNITQGLIPRDNAAIFCFPDGDCVYYFYPLGDINDANNIVMMDEALLARGNGIGKIALLVHSEEELEQIPKTKAPIIYIMVEYPDANRMEEPEVHVAGED